MPADATQAEIAQAVQSLGLDLPLYQQYLKFVGNALHGDLGNSFVFNQPAIQLIWPAWASVIPTTGTASTCAIRARWCRNPTCRPIRGWKRP